jgi:PAS domain S-box-containing protein
VSDIEDDALFLASVVENLPNMVFVKDARELRFVRFNRAGEELIGFPRDELIGKNDFDFFPESEARFFTEKDREVLRGGRLVDIPEEPIHTRERGVRWLHTKKIPILGASGEPRYLLGISEDITERKRQQEQFARHSAELASLNAELLRAQRDLRATEERLRVMLAHFPGCMVAADADLLVTSTGGWSAQLLGVAEADVAGSPVLDLPILRGLPGIAAALDAALDGERTSSELAHGERLYEVTVEPLEHAESRVIIVLDDVTERRRLEAERLERRLQQYQKLESLGILAGGIAHDFNNLLVGILGNASLALLDIAAGSPARRSVEWIEQSAERAAELTRQLLAYSGKGRFVVEPIDLSSVVGEMASLLEVSISKKATLQLDLRPGLPRVEADVAQIRQVVMNLITNASDALADRTGRIMVSTGLVEADREYLDGSFIHDDIEEGRYVSIEVGDTGVGMTPETQSRMFDPFFTTKEQGHGLGLAAALGIVRGHRGAIRVYSEPGKGTTVKLLLPASDRTGQTDVSLTPVDHFEPVGALLMIVDDEASVRRFARAALERLGYEVLEAEDGKRAVELFRLHEERVALVILDMTMPEMSGEDAFREMRRLRPSVRVLLSSGYNEQEVTSRFADKGLAGFLQKPYRVAELQRAVASLLGPDELGPG